MNQLTDQEMEAFVDQLDKQVTEKDVRDGAQGQPSPWPSLTTSVP